MHINYPKEVGQALDQLQEAGHCAYLVGGCVRDGLRGVTPTDFDLTTDAEPPEIAKVFQNERVIETGLIHGTLTVQLGGLSLEITSHRREGRYSDGRHPDRVEFSKNLHEDLARRDFTINAMAYHPTRGLIDPFGGQGDLQAGLIRCVGEAERRFSEDALRMLRGLRFASILGFSIEEGTDNALRKGRDGLRGIAAERVREELDRLLCGENVRRVLEGYVEELGVVLPVLPALKAVEHGELLRHTALAVSYAPAEPMMRWAMLLHDIGRLHTGKIGDEEEEKFYNVTQESARLAEEILKNLRFDKAGCRRIIDLISHFAMPLKGGRIYLQRQLSQLGVENFFALLSLKRANKEANTPLEGGCLMQFDELEKEAQDLLQEGLCLGRKDLAVKGRDLFLMGFSGKALGDALKFLLEAVLDGQVSNEKSLLLALLQGEKQDKNSKNLKITVEKNI